MNLWESILLCLWWAFYVAMVYRTDLLTTRCCCCIPPEPTEFDETVGDEEDAMVTAIENGDATKNPEFEKKESLPSPDIAQSPNKSTTINHSSLSVPDLSHCHNAVRISRAIPQESHNAMNDLQRLLDALDRRQQQNV